MMSDDSVRLVGNHQVKRDHFLFSDLDVGRRVAACEHQQSGLHPRL